MELKPATVQKQQSITDRYYSQKRAKSQTSTKFEFGTAAEHVYNDRDSFRILQKYTTPNLESSKQSSKSL